MFTEKRQFLILICKPTEQIEQNIDEENELCVTRAETKLQ